MHVRNLARIGAVVLIAIGLAACDGSENYRTLPTAPPEYQSPAMIGPEIPGDHQPGQAGEGDSHVESSGGKKEKEAAPDTANATSEAK